jgi:hypothetical protein
MDRGRQDVHHPAQSTEQAADDQRLHLDREDVLAEAAHRVLVLADATQRPAPRAPDQQRDQDQGDGHQQPGDDGEPPALDPGVLLGHGSQEEDAEGRHHDQAGERDPPSGTGERAERATTDLDRRDDQSDDDEPPDQPHPGGAAGDVAVVEAEDRRVAVTEEGHARERSAVAAAGDALRAAGEVEERLVADRAADVSHDLRGRDGHDRQVVASELQRWYAEHEREDERQQQPDDHREEERHVLGDGDREAVGAEQHERGLADVEQAGVAEVDVEPDHGDRDGGGLRGEHLAHHRVEDLLDVVHRSSPF